MTTTTTTVFWNPLVVYEPLVIAHSVALAEAAATGTRLAPGRINVIPVPTGAFTGTLTATGKGAVYQEFGTKPHEIDPKTKRAVAGKGFGPFAKVQHPGNPALHFTARGAETYPEAFLTAGRAAFVL